MLAAVGASEEPNKRIRLLQRADNPLDAFDGVSARFVQKRSRRLAANPRSPRARWRCNVLNSGGGDVPFAQLIIADGAQLQITIRTRSGNVHDIDERLGSTPLTFS